MAEGEIRFYTRPGCHLCDRALEILRAALAERPLELRVFDVEDDRELEARWGNDVPVVELRSPRGTRVFRHHLDPDTLTAELEDLWRP